MATKVDRTASMMCRRSGCSSEKLAERVLELEAALRQIHDQLTGNYEGLGRPLDELAAAAQAALKGNDLGR